VVGLNLASSAAASWFLDCALSDVKFRDLVEMIEHDEWTLVRTKGSHRQFKHSCKPGTVTVAGKPNLDVPPGTLNSILKQAGLKGRKTE